MGTKGSTKEGSELLERMFDAWNGEGAALLFELAKSYTERYPENYWGWVLLADALGGLARYNEAERALRRAQRLVPTDRRGNVSAHWGHLYDTKCDLRRSERWYRRALKESRGNNKMRCLIYLGAVLAKQGRLTEAESCHRKAIGLAGDPPDEAYYNLGSVLRAQGKYREALKYFNRAVRIDPGYTIANTAWKDVMNAVKFTKQTRREKS